MDLCFLKSTLQPPSLILWYPRKLQDIWKGLLTHRLVYKDL